MFRSIPLTTLVAALFFSPTGVSSEISGDILYGVCRNDDEASSATCFAFVDGALQGHRDGATLAFLTFFNLVALEVSKEKYEQLKHTKVSNLLGYCLPDGISGEQLTDTFLRYLSNNPEIRHRDGSALLMRALDEAFPCNE